VYLSPRRKNGAVTHACVLRVIGLGNILRKDLGRFKHLERAEIRSSR
jgi:hypothetical protein